MFDGGVLKIFVMCNYSVGKEFLVGKIYEITTHKYEILSIYMFGNKYHILEHGLKHNSILSETGRVFDNCGKGYYTVNELNSKMVLYKFEEYKKIN